MNVLILLCIIALGVTVLRMVLGAVTILFTGKLGTAKVGPLMRFWNLAETVAVVYAFVLLVIRFYA